jgi:hypothetical protein
LAEAAALAPLPQLQSDRLNVHGGETKAPTTSNP